MGLNITMCSRCGGQVNPTMRFCPACGMRLVQRDSRFKLKVGVAALVVFGLGVGLQKALISPPPVHDKHHSEASVVEDAKVEVQEDPQLAVLRRDLESEPQNIEKLKMMAGMLGDKLRQDPRASGPLVFETIDILSRILAFLPNDAGALLMMADVSFDQKAFVKAKEFYERYLKLEPDNNGARARYSSALTFLGEFDRSISELQGVLKSDPANFPAMAYLAITYAQKGEPGKAKEIGAAALKLAPSEEARARFSSFVDSLERASTGSGDNSKADSSSDQSAKGLEAFIAQIKRNPVAGPKFVGHQQSDDSLRITFKDFPMAQMPPFAKDKFFGSLRKAASDSDIAKIRFIIFVDLSSGQEMDRLELVAPASDGGSGS